MAAFTREAATFHVQAWLASQSQEDSLLSEWVLTEFASALSVKRRMGSLRAEERHGAQLRVERFSQGIEVAALDTRHFRLAASLAARHDAGLRAGDALHVAVCVSEGALLCTLDKRLAASGESLGLSVSLI